MLSTSLTLVGKHKAISKQWSAFRCVYKQYFEELKTMSECFVCLKSTGPSPTNPISTIIAFIGMCSIVWLRIIMTLPLSFDLNCP